MSFFRSLVESSSDSDKVSTNHDLRKISNVSEYDSKEGSDEVAAISGGSPAVSAGPLAKLESFNQPAGA